MTETENANKDRETELIESMSKMETLLRESVAGWNERDRRKLDDDLAMRAYFTEELGRLREAIYGELRIRAVRQFLQEVISILNDLDELLERSAEAALNETTVRIWNALEAYRRRFYNCLRRLGLEEIKIAEKETIFDPHVHECVDTVDGAEKEIPPGMIVKVRRRGYLFQKELFQAPQVIITGGLEHA